MAYNEALAERLRRALADRPEITEKKMFGGVCFLLNGNMLCGTAEDWFMFRVGKELEAEALKRPGASPMQLTGKPMGGILQVEAEQVRGNAIGEWIERAEVFVGSLPPKE